MGHVDHERGADLVGDLAHDPEVHETGVCGVAGDDDQRLELAGRGTQRLVVDQARGGVGAVGALVEHLAGDVGAEAVGEVAAGVQGHAEHALVAEGAAQLGPVGLGEVVDLADAGLLQGGGLDALGEDGPEGDEVGVDAGVGLDVCVAGAEELAGVLGGEGLDGVDVAAAGVEAAADGALGVLVAEPVAHRQEGGRGGVVLGGDQLEHLALVGDLLADRIGHARLDGADHVEGGTEGGGLGGEGLGGHGDLRTSCAAITVRPRRTALGLDFGPGAAPRWLVHPSAPVTARRSAYRAGRRAMAARPPCEPR